VVGRLAEAHHAGRLQHEFVRLAHYPLLVIHEVGYIRFEAEAANRFFQLVSSRYERASLIVTTAEQFAGAKCSAVVIVAMIDASSTTPKSSPSTGDSYRLKGVDISRGTLADG